MAAGFRADVFGARHSAIRILDPGGNPAAVLDNGGPLPRTDLEWRGAGAVVGCQRIVRAALLGLADERVHDSAIAALARQLEEASSESTKNLFLRHRVAPPIARHPNGERIIDASEMW